jgi:hypothetical protein
MADWWDFDDGPTTEELIEVQARGVPDCFRIQTLSQMGVIGRSRLFELIRSGQLKAKKLGSSTIILRSEWLRFLQTLPDVNVRKREAARRELAKVRRARVQERAATRPDSQSHERRSTSQRRRS